MVLEPEDIVLEPEDMVWEPEDMVTLVILVSPQSRLDFDLGLPWI